MLALGLFGFLLLKARASKRSSLYKAIEVASSVDFEKRQAGPQDMPRSDDLTRIARTIKKYAVAEIAAIIGIPLAIGALGLTALASRDTARQLDLTARQLSLTKEQSQPTFRVVPRRYRLKPTRSIQFAVFSYDEISVQVEGNANNISAKVGTKLITFTPVRRNESVFLRRSTVPFDYWWYSEQPKPGEVARWSADQERVEGFRVERGQESVLALHLISIFYEDVFGEKRSTYFSLVQTIKNGDTFAGIVLTRPPYRLDVAEGRLCSEEKQDSGMAASELSIVSLRDANKGVASFEEALPEEIKDLDGCLSGHSILWLRRGLSDLPVVPDRD